MDSPNSPTDEQQRQESPQAAAGPSSPTGDTKPSQTSSILKERRFKLSRCVLLCEGRSASSVLTRLTRSRLLWSLQGMRPLSVSACWRELRI